MFLEICAHVQGSDLTSITGMWWDGFHEWNVRTEGYWLCSKDGQGRGHGGVAVCVNDQLECMELCWDE